MSSKTRPQRACRQGLRIWSRSIHNIRAHELMACPRVSSSPQLPQYRRILDLIVPRQQQRLGYHLRRLRIIVRKRQHHPPPPLRALTGTITTLPPGSRCTPPDPRCNAYSYSFPSISANRSLNLTFPSSSTCTTAPAPSAGTPPCSSTPPAPSPKPPPPPRSNPHPASLR